MLIFKKHKCYIFNENALPGKLTLMLKFLNIIKYQCVYIFSIGFVFCYLILDIKYYLKHSIQDQFKSPSKLQENKENRNIENITYENYRYQSNNENNTKSFVLKIKLS